MSDTGRDHDLIPDHAKDNYRTLVQTSGKTWPDLAAQFRRDADHAGAATARGRGYEQLAHWADGEAAAAADREAAQKPPKRDARKQIENAPRPATGPARTTSAG